MYQDKHGFSFYKSWKKRLLIGCQGSSEPIQCLTVRKPYDSPNAARAETSSVDSSCRDIASISLDGKEKRKTIVAQKEDNELELSKIREGAESLNNIIKLWSKGASAVNERSNEITEDLLLRGAWELQESLAMLKKQSDVPKIKRNDHKNVVGVEEQSVSRQAGLEIAEVNSHYKTRWERKRHFSEGSSSNIFDFSVQNLVSTRRGVMEACHDRKSKPESSVCPMVRQNKTQSPSLIARLMGLDQVPSEIIQPVREHRKKNAMRNNSRPSSGTELSEAIAFVEEKHNLEGRTLQELLETMHFNGFLKVSEGDRHGTLSCFHNSSQMGRYGRNFVDEVPPIVVIRPMHLSKKKDFKEEVSSRGLVCNASKEIQASHTMKKKIPGDHVKEDKKERPEIKLLSERTNPSAIISSKEKGKKVMMSKKLKKMGQNQITEVHKMGAMENKKVGATTISNSETEKGTPTTKQEKRPSSERMHVLVPKNPLNSNVNDSNSVALYLANAISKDVIDSEKEKKNSETKHTRHISDLAVAIDLKCEECGKEFSTSQSVIDLPPVTTSSTTNGDHPKLTKNVCKIPIKGRRKTDPNFLYEMMPKPNQGGSHPVSSLEDSMLANNIVSSKQLIDEDEDIKLLILSSPSFILQVKKLFILDVYPLEDCQKRNKEVTERRNANLVLECATEFLESKCHHLQTTNQPMLQSQAWGSKANDILYQLADEISRRIHELKSYANTGSDVSSMAGVYMRLEKDLCSSTMLGNGGWDLSWVDGVSPEEQLLIACDVEQYILSFLLNELLMEMAC